LLLISNAEAEQKLRAEAEQKLLLISDAEAEHESLLLSEAEVSEAETEQPRIAVDLRGRG